MNGTRKPVTTRFSSPVWDHAGGGVKKHEDAACFFHLVRFHRAEVGFGHDDEQDGEEAV